MTLGPDVADNHNSTPKTFEADPQDAGQRLDVWLVTRIPSLSRRQIQLDIKRGNVWVNGEPKPARYRLRGGDSIEVRLTDRPEISLTLEPAGIALDVVFEDDDLIVIDKPSGLVVHPAPGHTNDTLANALLAHVGPEIGEVGGEGRCGIVHRLDKLTSGLILVAKTDSAHAALTADMAARRIGRRYLGLALGHFKDSEGEIDKPIGRRPRDRKKMGIVENGRTARTSYRVLLQGEAIALLLIRLHTGRTHQIRVHFQSIGRPIAGDRDYGYTKRHSLQMFPSLLRSKLGPHWPERQMLHAAGLGFVHPRTGDILRYSSPPPEDMADMIDLIFGPAAIDFSDRIESDLNSIGISPDTEMPDPDDQ